MSFIYNLAKNQIIQAELDLSSETFQVMLVDSDYSASESDTYLDTGGASDPVDAELSGTGYERKTLSTFSFTQDDTNNRIDIDADDVTWSRLTAGTAVGAIIFLEGPTDDTDALMIAYIDDGFPFTTEGSNFTLQWNSNGVFRLS